MMMCSAGENSIVIVGGANTAEWNIDEESRQVLQSAGGLLLQREIPEEVNTLAAKVCLLTCVLTFLRD